ncbi:TerD family protein [Acinetobacter ursingii]|uniref:TerD family protein n=1 Tax=Acinetobacter ursingii TaxID=108980 RepID=UPI004034093A
MVYVALQVLLCPTTNVEIAKYNLSAKGNYTALIIAKVYRHNGAWKMSALGETCNGKTIQDMVPSILPIL